MYIMSVDVGTARTGVALSDKGEGFAFPKCVITEYNREKLIEKLEEDEDVQNVFHNMKEEVEE